MEEYVECEEYHAVQVSNGHAGPSSNKNHHYHKTSLKSHHQTSNHQTEIAVFHVKQSAFTHVQHKWVTVTIYTILLWNTSELSLI